MAKVTAFHTTSEEYPPANRNVHHNNDECHEGKKIKKEHRKAGTNNKPLCAVCAKL